MKEFIKKYHPIPRIIRSFKARELDNSDFTILSSNCLGGIIYHLLGSQFCSPTINMRISSNEFIRMLNNINDYLKLPLEEVCNADEVYPVAKLGDVFLHLNHYKTFEDAKLKWEQRLQRINWDNIYITLNDLDGVTEKDIRALSNFNCNNIVVFTHKKYDDIPYTYYVGDETKLKHMLNRSLLTGLYDFENWFDYVSFINSKKIK